LIAPEWERVRRLLVVRLDNLGDVILTTPAVRALAESLPEAEISLLASPVGTQIGLLNPHISQVITYRAPWVDPWQQIPHDPEREQAMIARLRDEQFDAAVIFSSFRQSSLPAAYLCYLAGIPLRLGASIDASGSLLTTRHKHPEQMMHEVERGLDLVGAIGAKASSHDLELHVPERERRTAAEWLASDVRSATSGPVIVVHPGCSMPARTYPWWLYAETIELLVSRLDAAVIVTGLASERELVARIFEQLSLKAQERVVCRVADAPLGSLSALIEQADLAITNNTGPMHVAAAVKTPVVVLFALTNPPEQWKPWNVPHMLLYRDVPCRICYSRSCPLDHACLLEVGPAEVVEASEQLVDGVRALQTMSGACA
jgi:ADP-heptose:LPS heptosyltransferase